MSPTTTRADAPQADSTAALAPLVALVAAQAAARARLTAQAVAVATAAATRFHGWYDSDRITEWAAGLAKQIEALQRAQAQSTDAYLARAMSTIAGGGIRPSGRVDVSALRDGVTHAGAYARAADVYRWQQSQFDQFARVLAETKDVAALAPLDIADPVTAAQHRVAAVADMDMQLADRAQSAQSMQDQRRRLDIRGYRRVIHPELSKGGTCGLCIAASDRVYHVDDLKALHGRCFPGDTRVRADGVSAITRRNYSGAFVVLTTAAGQQVRVTPNHPVLTDDGWVPAGLINIGGQVVRHLLGERMADRGPYEGNGPATLEQIWRAATVDARLRPSRVPLAPEDFHGDGFDGEVEVVATDGLFAHIGDVSFAQPLTDPRFMSGHGPGVPFASDGGAFEAIFGLWDPARRSVGSGGLALAILTGGLLQADGSSELGVAMLGALFAESQIDDMSGYAERSGYSQHGFACRMSHHDLVVRKAQPDPSRFNPAFAEFSGEGRHAYAKLGRNLRDRLAGEVELDRVVDKRWVEGTHAVYNLQTREGWFAADNLIVSNCECTVLPIVGQLDPGSGLNNLDLNSLYAHAGDSTNRVDLKRTRYKIDQHGELGPVLTDGKFRTERQARRATNRPPSKPKTIERTQLDIERVLQMEMGAQSKAHELAKADPKRWGAYADALDARISDLHGQLAQQL